MVVKAGVSDEDGGDVGGADWEGGGGGDRDQNARPRTGAWLKCKVRGNFPLFGNEAVIEYAYVLRKSLRVLLCLVFSLRLLQVIPAGATAAAVEEVNAARLRLPALVTLPLLQIRLPPRMRHVMVSTCYLERAMERM